MGENLTWRVLNIAQTSAHEEGTLGKAVDCLVMTAAVIWEMCSVFFLCKNEITNIPAATLVKVLRRKRGIEMSPARLK
jgi:hypothetical protein